MEAAAWAASRPAMRRPRRHRRSREVDLMSLWNPRRPYKGRVALLGGGARGGIRGTVVEIRQFGPSRQAVSCAGSAECGILYS
ncbi:hypothetical protein Emed_007248 [Eimeria media]